MIKKIFLGVALVLPVAIYLFLQSFGSNVYELPRMYQDKLPEMVMTACDYARVPYKVRLDAYTQNTSLPVVFDVRFPDADNVFSNNEMKRISQYFKGRGFLHFVITDQESGIEGAVEQIIVEDLYEFAMCDLINTENKSFLVLVDKDGIIRGQYEGNRKQEFDRLIVEIEILLKFN